MKSVLVTGGTVRLGLAISARLREDGWRVLTASHRCDAGADLVADLSSPQGAARLYAEACALLGGVPPDALVNNAAIFSGDAEAVDMLNFESPKKLTVMMAGREEGVGSVVNILDCRVLADSAEAGGPYCESKRKLLEWTKKSAAMFCSNLRVNAVAPGPVMASPAVHEPAGETPLGRPSPEDVAEAVAFLLSARRTSGCVVPVDGAQSLVS
jgi:NAD(P)-dependent dehydrogenase (short-subunit alcohol dehydrogenase family)